MLEPEPEVQLDSPDECFAVSNNIPEFSFETNVEDIVWETVFFNVINKDKLISNEELTETEQKHFKGNSVALLKTDAKRKINYHNLITPKFLEKEWSFASQDCALKSIYAHSCKITVILQEGSETRSFIGSGVIVLKDKSLDYMMALTSAHIFYPKEMNNPIIKGIFIVLSNGRQFKECDGSLVETGDFKTKKDHSSDWALLKVNSGMTNDLLEDSLTLIPSPSESRALNHFTETEGYPCIYSTLLIGYFTKGTFDNDCREFKRLREIGFEIEDVWKIIPFDMALSFGWTTSCKPGNNPVYNCGTTICCSGGPLFKCRINVDRLGEIVKYDQITINETELKNLFQKSYISTRIMGLHSGGAYFGNIACSAIHFFKSYYQHVYLPHQDLFSLSDQIFIETELQNEGNLI